MHTLQQTRIIPAALSGGGSLIALFFLQRFVTLQFFALFLFVYISILVFLRFFLYPRMKYQYPVFPLSVVLALSSIGLLFVVEIIFVRQLISLFLVVTQSLLWGWGGAQGELSVSMKPFRRFVVFNWVFCVYASLTALFAFSAFFPQKGVYLLVVFLGAVLNSAIALHILKQYFQTTTRSLFLWALLIGVVSIELLWVISLLPFAYGFLGLIGTWFWYIIVLFTRFHFGKKGVLWKKQLPFLVTNLILFVLLLTFFVRWV